jgi:hypothetical protein
MLTFATCSQKFGKFQAYLALTGANNVKNYFEQGLGEFFAISSCKT